MASIAAKPKRTNSHIVAKLDASPPSIADTKVWLRCVNTGSGQAKTEITLTKISKEPDPRDIQRYVLQQEHGFSAVATARIECTSVFMGVRPRKEVHEGIWLTDTQHQHGFCFINVLGIALEWIHVAAPQVTLPSAGLSEAAIMAGYHAHSDSNQTHNGSIIVWPADDLSTTDSASCTVFNHMIGRFCGRPDPPKNMKRKGTSGDDNDKSDDNKGKKRSASPTKDKTTPCSMSH